MQIKQALADLAADKVTWQLTQMKKLQPFEAPLSKVLAEYAGAGFIDTGLLPVGPHSGLLALRGGFGHLQMVYQVEPGLHPVMWGRSERDPNAKVYSLAQPWRIWIADFFNGNISGIRHFYTLEPISEATTPLYHVNLPNTNCKGYNGTGVGWMCLYHTDNTTEYNIAQLLAYAYTRASGSEAYNDNNMSETDGPRFYAQKKKPTYFTDPTAWQKKSLAEGFKWTLDPKLLVPVMVINRDDQARGDHGDHHLTLDDAMNGSYYSSYPHKRIDTQPIKPIAAMQRGIFEKTYPTLMQELFEKILTRIGKRTVDTGISFAPHVASVTAQVAAVKALSISTIPLVPHGTCANCNKALPLTDLVPYAYLPEHLGVLSETMNASTLPVVCPTCTTHDEIIQIYLPFYFSPEELLKLNLTDNLLYVSSGLTVYNDALDAAVIESLMYSVACPNCNTNWPSNFDKYSENDWRVYIPEGIDPKQWIHGCSHCIPDFGTDVISGLHVGLDLLVELNLTDYTGHGTGAESSSCVTVASVFVGPEGTHAVCACNILSHKTQFSELVSAGMPVCHSCVKDDEYKSVYNTLAQEVEEFF